MTAEHPNDPPAPGAPSTEAVDAFCQYLRLLELGQEVDWEKFCSEHPDCRPELGRLLDEYERVTAILDSLAPAASFSARLRAHYGDSVDPVISLSGDERSASSGSGAGTSATTGRVLARLVAQSPHTRRYEPRREIARGGMGAILEVWDAELRRTLAMKVVLTGRSGTTVNEESADVAERRLSRFLEEAQITGQLDHPGIVPVHDIGLDDQGRVYFTMQLIDGLDLRKVFELARLERDGWNHHRAVSVLMRVCEAVAFAHSKGVVHRDLKPANIMVGRFGEAYVMDWGLAKVLGRESPHEGRPPEPKKQESRRVKTDRSDEDTDTDSALKTLDGDIVGTPAYMAPEQARGKLEEIGPRSDVYAMGAMLYHLLSGHMPYEPLGEKVPAHTILEAVRKAPPWPLQQLNPDVDGELAAICEKSMSREPERRYGDMMALAEDLRAWVEGRGVGAYTTGVFYETRKWMARNKATTIALGALLGLILISISLFIWQQQRSFWKLAAEKQATEDALAEAAQAKSEADGQRRAAVKSAEEMRRERDRADEQTGFANKQTALATEEARKSALATADALRSEKMAQANAYRLSINAASYSLRLDEVAEAKKSLGDCRDDLRGWEWNHLSLAKDRRTGAPIVQEAGVTDLSCSADGSAILTYGLGLVPRVFSVDSGRRTTELEGPGFLGFRAEQRLGLLRVSLSHDGALAMVTRPADQSMQLFNTSTQQLLYSWPRQPATITGVEFHPDASRVAAASDDGTAAVFDCLNGRVVSRLVGHDGRVECLSFNGAGTKLATGGVDLTARVWDAASGGELARLEGQHSARVAAVAWSLDGSRIATASEDHSLAIWNAESGVLLAGMHGHDGAVLDVAFTVDGEHLISGSEDRTVRIWDVATGREERVLLGHDEAVSSVVCLRHDNLIASASLDGSVRVWDTAWDSVSTEVEPGELGLGLGFAPDSRTLYAVGPKGNCRVIDADTGLVIDFVGNSASGTQDYYRTAAVSPDGRWLALSMLDPAVELWDRRTGELARTFSEFDRAVAILEFSESGRYLAFGTTGRKAYVEDLENPGDRTEFGLIRSLEALAISPDGSKLATAETDESLRLWGIPGGGALASRRDAHDSQIEEIAFDPSGEFLATVARDRRLRVWSTRELEMTVEGEGHSDRVVCVDFSPTEARLVTGSYDGTLRLWDQDTGDNLLVLRGHSGAVFDVKFSPNGSRIASCGVDTIARLWETGRVDERYQARREALRLRGVARELIRDLHDALGSVELVRSAVIDDASLDPELKRAARMELLEFHPEGEPEGSSRAAPGERE